MNRLEYDEVEIPSPTDLRAAAKAALSDLQTIEALNPELRRGCTPPNQETYRIRVPRGSSERFLAVLGAMPPEERFKVGQYTAKRGDTLNGVAKTSGVRASILAEYNGLDAKTALKPGTELRIPMVYVRDGETEDKWDKKLNKRLSKMRGKKARAARKTVGSSDLPHGGGG
jgi:membrane-bound lytic murein transglycosylase D